MHRLILALVSAFLACSISLAQERKPMTRPYVDNRRFHWGFALGTQLQDMEFGQSGYVDPETGEQWWADVDNYNPGLTVSLLGEMRLTKTLALRLVPTMHFGQRHIVFHEQTTQRDTTQNLKSTYISLPIDLKVAAPRYNNFRPYLVGGLAPSVDLMSHKRQPLYTRPFDVLFEIGAGCDIYLPFFKLIPELKFSFGLLDILKKNRTDLTNNSLIRYTNALSSAHTKMITLSFYFE